MDEWAELGARVVALAERLVHTPSVVDSAGEAAVAELLAAYLREQAAGCAGFELQVVEVPKPTACGALLAYAPPAQPTDRALALLGHFDTVGLEPYGALADQAFDSPALKAHFAQAPQPELREAAQSPDWAFGRGWLDMKGGVAAAVEVFLHELRQRELPAHLLLLLTPDEESASRGVRALIPPLTELAQKRGLKLARVVNVDYTAPLYPGDSRRYLYTGTVGKLLLGVSVFGRTTHVGETFNGVNATALAGYLAAELEHNRKLLKGAGGEWLPPPTVLHAGDRRARYDVMTLDYAELYANVFHVGGRAKLLWRELLSEVRRLTRRWERALRLRYNRFTARADLQLPRYGERCEVLGYAELVQRAEQHCGAEFAARFNEIKSQALATAADAREQALALVRGLQALLPPGRPLVVVSLLPPFYPAQLAEARSPATLALLRLGAENGLTPRRIYPYIADMSYFAFSEPDEIKQWARHSPLWFAAGEVESYARVAAPVLNLGPWGLGAHSAEERVYLPYLRDQLPQLLSATLHTLAQDG